MDWNDFVLFYDWEMSIVCENQKKDVGFWIDFNQQNAGTILEIGSGTGRVTLPLAEAGFEITALDNANKYLEILKAKVRPELKINIIEADMLDFSLDKKFDKVLFPYSTFQYLLTLEDQIQVLKNVWTHLKEGGLIALDISPDVCEGPLTVHSTLLYKEYYPPLDTEVSMYTSYDVNKLLRIKNWRDTYVSVDRQGKREVFKHEMSLKEITLEGMILMLEHCGYEMRDIYGSFSYGTVEEESENLIFVAQKRE